MQGEKTNFLFVHIILKVFPFDDTMIKNRNSRIKNYYFNVWYNYR